MSKVSIIDQIFYQSKIHSTRNLMISASKRIKTKYKSLAYIGYKFA